MRSMFALLTLAMATSSASAAPPNQKELAHVVAAGKQNLVDQLKDPGSVQYRNLYVSKSETGELVLCGEYNAKNGYGGYGGFEPFIASREKLLYTGGILYGQLCGAKVAPAK